MIQKLDFYEDFLAKRVSVQCPLADPDIFKLLSKMQSDVIADGDGALCRYTKQFDGVGLSDSQLVVTDQVRESAYAQVTDEVVDALKRAVDNIYRYHQYQVPKDWQADHQGMIYGMQYRPLSCAGLYVPGGRAPYPSTVLMNAIPARVAGVKQLVMVTPPRSDGTIHPAILVAANLCEVDVVIGVGGAQAIFGLAYGTKSVPKVDVIVGPGNKYVTMAKQMVFGQVAIDKPAGPSEVLVYLDDERYVDFAAAELLAQLEHDPDASAVLVVTHDRLFDLVEQAFGMQIKQCKRQTVLTQSVKQAVGFVVTDFAAALEIINGIASEHLVLLTDQAERYRKQIDFAGAIFCGPFTPVALGDYFAGPNHVLPTAGTARFSAPLSVSDFVTFSSFLTASKDSLAAVASDLKVLTDVEGFDAHYQTIRKRLA